MGLQRVRHYLATNNNNNIYIYENFFQDTEATKYIKKELLILNSLNVLTF